MSFRGATSGHSGNSYERSLKSSKSLSSSHSSTDGEPSHKLVLVGDSGVGKSCLLEKLLDLKSQNNFISTIGVDVKNHAIKSEDGKLVRLQVRYKIIFLKSQFNPITWAALSQVNYYIA